MCLCKVCLLCLVECSLFKVAHLPFFHSNKLMARINVTVRCNRNVFIAATAATQTLDGTRALIQIQHEVEEIELLSGLLIIQNLIHQYFVFFEDCWQICFCDCIWIIFICHNWFYRNLVKSMFQQVKYIVREVQIVLGISTTYIIFLIATLCNQTLIFRQDNVIAALAVYSLPHPVINCLSAVNGKNNIGHFLVDEINITIIQQHTVCGNRESEMFPIFLFLASCISNNLLHHFKIHQRFTAEEVQFQILPVCGMLQQEINCLFSGFQRHQLSALAEVTRRSKTIFTTQVAVMGNMQTHCLNRRSNGTIRILFIIIFREENLFVVCL